MNANLSSALDAYKSVVEERYRDLVRGRFELMVREFGPALSGVSNSTLARSYHATVQPNIRETSGSRFLRDWTYEVSEEKVAANAKAYAEATVAAWARKIDEKMGELEAAEVDRLDGCTFRIRGLRGGRSVRIEQSIIVNVSPKGTVFNQFPARLYVDGKATSAAKFKALAA